MKNLWKYLSTLGLMLVACLCLGVGLKASDVSFGAMGPGVENHDIVTTDEKACVYIANGKHEMKGGTIGGKAYGIYISGGTFTMSGGTISNCSSYGVYVSGGTFNYSAGTISDEIYLSSSKYITLTKAPTSTLKIRLSSTSSGTRVAYLSGISSLTSTQLSYLNVVNMPSGYRLEVSSGYVVLAQASTTTNYTVTIKAGVGGRVSASSLSVRSGTTFNVDGSILNFDDGQSVTAVAGSGYIFDHWSESGGSVTADMTITANFVTGERSIIEKIEEGGTIKIFYCGSSLDFDTYTMLKILIDHPQDFIVDESMYQYVYELLEDVYQDYDPYGRTDYLAKIQTYAKQVTEGRLSIDVIFQTGLGTGDVFKEWVNEQAIDDTLRENLDQYDLIFAPRIFVPNTYEYDNGADITNIQDVRLGNNFYNKNKIIYGFNPTIGAMNLMDYDIADYLIQYGFVVFNGTYGGDYEQPPLLDYDFADLFIDWLKKLADGLYGQLEIMGGAGPMSDSERDNLRMGYLEYDFDIDKYFEYGYDDYNRPLIFFDLHSAYDEIVELYERAGEPLRALYDISYIVYRLLSSAFGNWFEGYWAIGGVGGFGEQMGAYLKGMSYAKDTLDDALDRVNMDDFMAISNIACALRNRGIEYWYWKDYQSGYWDDAVPYVYVGVDEMGMISIMVARQGEHFESFGYDPGIIPGDYSGFPTRDYLSMSLNAPFYDNKQYYLFPIKVKK